MAIIRREHAITDTEIKRSSENDAAENSYGILPADVIFPAGGRVACQGVRGANAQLAAEKMFPLGKLLFFKTFEGVVEAVHSGLADYGVLPIENNTYGSVRAVYGELKKGEVMIIRGEKLLIRHELLVNPGTRLSAVRKIYSHEQAIGQCSRFLKGLKNVEVIPVLNTAVAARQISVSGENDAAAIASSACIDLYNLERIDADIQDSDNNYTRFICVAKEPAVYPGSNRISLILSVPHRPGALCRVLEILAKAGIDMIKLESAPIPGRDFEFMFYMDIAASVADPAVRRILEEIKEACRDFLYLGNYLEN